MVIIGDFETESGSLEEAMDKVQTGGTAEEAGSGTAGARKICLSSRRDSMEGFVEGFVGPWSQPRCHSGWHMKHTRSQVGLLAIT